MRTEGEGPSPLERWEQRYPANAQAVHGECTVELEKWEQTLHGCPWRRTKGAAPCAVKVARTVLNGGDEETYRKATRLVPTQRECDGSYGSRSPPMTSCCVTARPPRRPARTATSSKTWRSRK